jgi:hypothetical protein
MTKRRSLNLLAIKRKKRNKKREANIKRNIKAQE